MRILCCYTKSYNLTKAALEKYAPDFEAVYVGDLVHQRDNDYAYWHAIRERWDGIEDLVIIEHDIEINEKVIPAFNECDNDWCTFAYQVVDKDTWLGAGLGCARFTAKLQRDIPVEVIEEKYRACWSCEPARMGKFSLQDVLQHGRSVKPTIPGCWRHLDLEIVGCCVQAGYFPCVHGGVTHRSIDSAVKEPDFSAMGKIDIFEWDKGLPPLVQT